MTAGGPDDRGETPNRFPWPPVLSGTLAVAAVVLGHVAPIGPALPAWLSDAGWALFGVAALFATWAAHTMRAAATNIYPHRGADRLVDHGPFAISRNPLYLASLGILAGLGFATGIAWFWVATAVDAVLLKELAIKREEAHMAARFGDAWERYRGRVPRWIGPF